VRWPKHLMLTMGKTKKKSIQWVWKKALSFRLCQCQSKRQLFLLCTYTHIAVSFCPNDGPHFFLSHFQLIHKTKRNKKFTWLELRNAWNLWNDRWLFKGLIPTSKKHWIQFESRNRHYNSIIFVAKNYLYTFNLM
jgi:hypothetical protein